MTVHLLVSVSVSVFGPGREVGTPEETSSLFQTKKKLILFILTKQTYTEEKGDKGEGTKKNEKEKNKERAREIAREEYLRQPRTKKQRNKERNE